MRAEGRSRVAVCVCVCLGRAIRVALVVKRDGSTLLPITVVDDGAVASNNLGRNRDVRMGRGRAARISSGRLDGSASRPCY